MPYCIVPKTGPGRIRAWEMFPDSPLDAATEQRVPVDRLVSLENEAWDGAQVVLRSAAEKEADLDAQEQREFDGARILRALAIWCAQRFGVPLAVARNEILAIYKSLR